MFSSSTVLTLLTASRTILIAALPANPISDELPEPLIENFQGAYVEGALLVVDVEQARSNAEKDLVQAKRQSEILNAEAQKTSDIQKRELLVNYAAWCVKNAEREVNISATETDPIPISFLEDIPFEPTGWEAAVKAREESEKFKNDRDARKEFIESGTFLIDYGLKMIKATGAQALANEDLKEAENEAAFFHTEASKESDQSSP